jgi:hypothetical protein
MGGSFLFVENGAPALGVHIHSSQKKIPPRTNHLAGCSVFVDAAGKRDC